MTHQPNMTEIDPEVRYDVQETGSDVFDASSEVRAGLADTARRAVATAREKMRDERFTGALKRLERADAELAEQLAQNVKRQQAENVRFDTRLDDLVKEVRRAPKRGGGMSLLPLVLIGVAGYFAWRNNNVRDRIQGLVQRLNPGAQGNAKRAEDAVAQGAQAIKHGESPMDAAKTASGEVKRGLEKGVDNTTDAARDAAHDLRRGAGQVTEDAKDAVRRAEENARRAAPDGTQKR